MATRITLLAFLLIGGCAADVGTGSSSLYEISADAIPLASFESGAWELVPAGCEDRLPATVTFEVADGANGLLVAVDEEGEAVCSDTAAAIAEELADEGRGEEADDLEASVAATFCPEVDDENEDVDFDPSADDPSPQPSRPDPEMHGMTPDDGESQPGDPSPQPS